MASLKKKNLSSRGQEEVVSYSNIELGSVQGEEFFKKAFSVSFSLCLIQHNKAESYIKN